MVAIKNGGSKMAAIGYNYGTSRIIDIVVHNGASPNTRLWDALRQN